MHELGIAQDMLRIAIEYATQNQAKRITALNIEMSMAADESEDSLRFHFEHLARGTLADGARIEIIRVPMRASCLDCANEFDFSTDSAGCPRCQSTRVRPLPQDEFKLTSIDVE